MSLSMSRLLGIGEGFSIIVVFKPLISRFPIDSIHALFVFILNKNRSRLRNKYRNYIFIKKHYKTRNRVFIPYSNENMLLTT